jgi:hypothetical protein
MKIWIEEDSQNFELHKSETLYGTPVEVDPKLIAEYENLTRRMGAIKREILCMLETQNP